MSDASDIPDTPPPSSGPEYERIDIVEEMKTSYLDYAMSVIVSRALPDVRAMSDHVEPPSVEVCHFETAPI